MDFTPLCTFRQISFPRKQSFKQLKFKADILSQINSQTQDKEMSTVLELIFKVNALFIFYEKNNKYMNRAKNNINCQV